MIIALDFDGTVVTQDFPEVGREIQAVPWLRKIQNSYNVSFILNTMRSGETLKEAEKWFERNKINLYGVNVNPDQKDWTTSPKLYAHLYVDDKSLGSPTVIPDGFLSSKPYIDWSLAGPAIVDILEEGGYRK